MASILIVGSPGPWESDDDLAESDGYFLNGQHAPGGITLDGDGGGSSRSRWRRRDSDDVIKGRVVRNEDSTSR